MLNTQIQILTGLIILLVLLNIILFKRALATNSIRLLFLPAAFDVVLFCIICLSL